MAVTHSTLKAIRGSFVHCLRDPGNDPDPGSAVEYFEDGVMLIEQGRVKALGPANELLPSLGPEVELIDHSGQLIVPGFIDTHVHYPQTDMIASYGEQLLMWLEHYTFPTEMRFADLNLAADTARFFVDQLLLNGTTTAMVFATVHPGSVDALFEAANARHMRIMAGKVLMDRNCPEGLRDSPEAGVEESRQLIDKWHGQDRLQYAITPRFAPTSTDQQLALAGRLAAEHPDVYVQTHLAESHEECDWVAGLFPHQRSYLDVYHHHGLVRERSIFAHCLHIDTEDRRVMSGNGAAIAFCPTSNLFLGSGLFDLHAARDHGIRVGLGTDVGAGTSFSQLQTASAGYKVAQMQGQACSPWQALYLMTLGGARALYLEDRIGNFSCGQEADLVVLDKAPTALMERRLGTTKSLSERLFVYLMLGDDRAIAATYLLGQRVQPGQP